MRLQTLLRSHTGDTQALLHAQGVCTTRDRQEDLFDAADKTGADKPMDTSLPPGDNSGTKAEEPMETDAVSEPHPSTSSPVSQNSSGVALEKTLSLPSQPEFPHDVSVPSQSQSTSSSSAAPRDTQKKPATPSSHDQKPSPSVESSLSTLPVWFSVNTERSTVAPLASEQPEDDSQPAHIEGVGEALCIDTSHSVMSRLSQRNEPNGASSSMKTAVEPKAAPFSLKHSGEGVRTEERAPSQRSGVQESMPMARKVTNVNVSHASGGSPMISPEDKVKGARLKSDTIDLANSCAPMHQSAFSQTTSEGSMSVAESELNTQSLLERGRFSTVPCQLLTLDVMDEGGEPEEDEKEVGMVKEGGSTLGREGSALGLALSQSQVLSPEPLETDGREEGSRESESERSPGPLEKEDGLSTQQKRNVSQPAGSKVSTNGHDSQYPPEDVRVAPDSLSQADREGPEAKGVKEKSLSDSSGEHHRVTSTLSGEMASKTYSTLSEEQREMDQGRGPLDARMQPVVKLYRIDFLLVQEESEPPQIKEEQDELLKRPNDGFLYIGHHLFSSSTQEVEEMQRRRVMAIFDEKSDEEEFLGFPDPEHASKSSKQTEPMGRQTGKKNLTCTECGKRFKDKGQLNRHTMIHTGKRPHTCSICGKGFVGRVDLTVHMRTHTGLKPFTCTVCYKGCRQLAHLKSHMRTHTGERPVTCTICGKGCAHNGQLKAHMRSHTGEKPFICVSCGKGFSYLNHLKTHLRIHTGEKSFICKVCGKGCTQKINLQTHMRTHTGERPVKCTLCGKALATMSSLRMHTRLHTGERPFKCNVCGKGCNAMDHLKTHMRTHTGEKPFICTFCGKGCSQRSHLKIHMTIHTRGKIVAKAVV